MIYLETVGIAYAAVPKAACTSVKLILSQLDPEFVAPTNPQRLRLHKRYRTSRFRLSRWQPYEDAFRFTMIRDPLRRLLAVYTNRVLQAQDLKSSPNLKHGRVDLPMAPDPDYFFQNLQPYMRAVSSIKHHALPTALFTGRDLGFFDRVYKTDEMEILASDLSRCTGVAVEASHTNASGVRLDLDDLQPDTRFAIAQFLEEDYAFLNRYFENPFH